MNILKVLWSKQIRLLDQIKSIRFSSDKYCAKLSAEHAPQDWFVGRLHWFSILKLCETGASNKLSAFSYWGNVLNSGKLISKTSIFCAKFCCPKAPYLLFMCTILGTMHKTWKKNGDYFSQIFEFWVLDLSGEYPLGTLLDKQLGAWCERLENIVSRLELFASLSMSHVTRDPSNQNFTLPIF